MLVGRAALLAAMAVGVGAQQPLPECRHTFPDGNTFDLSGLRKPPMYVPIPLPRSDSLDR
jgi:hypothetical protein